MITLSGIKHGLSVGDVIRPETYFDVPKPVQNKFFRVLSVSASGDVGLSWPCMDEACTEPYLSHKDFKGFKRLRMRNILRERLRASALKP